jgi:nucleotide-binding universal stress UspA family protein
MSVRVEPADSADPVYLVGARTMPTVLIAVDGSARSAQVFKTGAEAARAMHARAVVYRAFTVPPDFAPAAPANLPDTLPAYIEGEARTQLMSLTASVPDVRCELRVEQAAQPWRAILGAAEAVDADLIVLGSHGYHGLDHILGTTAGKVANLAHRDVLIVHGRMPREIPDKETAIARERS